jgi:trehalose/maltose hydrolase-like predicted phosphorylase
MPEKSAVLRSALSVLSVLFVPFSIPLLAQEVDPGFLLTTKDPARAPSPFIGNGRFAVAIPPLGFGPSLSFHAGLYEHGPGDVPRIVALPTWNGVAVSDGGGWLETVLPPDSSVHGDHWLEPLPPSVGSLRDYRQVLDMRSGTARTSYEWVNQDRRTSVAVESFVSRAAPGIAATRLQLTPRQRGQMRVRFALAARPRPRRLALNQISGRDPRWGPGDIWYPGYMVVRSRAATLVSGGARLSMMSTPVGRTSSLAQGVLVLWPRSLPHASVRTKASTEKSQVEVSFDASRDSTYVFTQLAAVGVTQPLAQLTRLLSSAQARGYDSLSADNAEAWRRRWESDIRIEGYPELQRVVRSMLFYLLSSADSGMALGIPPMGLSSAGYYGHIFWDSDTWMFPSLLVTHPDIARSLLAFRGRTLTAAQRNARANGYRGAMYPWEADELGNETTPHFAVQNARSEIHVNGDVALAQWQYYLATGDSSWLARDGYPVIRETANFWVSRAVYDSANDQYHIKNVVSVAEGLIGVSDDAYTNAVARKNLEIAVAASELLGRRADSRWPRVAAKLHLPYDSASQFFRTYEGAPDSTLGAVTPLLSYPLGVQMSTRSKRAQLEQAVRQLLEKGPGAMMGSTLLSVDAAELGDRALMDSLLPHSYQGHMKGPFMMLSETPTNNGVNFVTGAGGFLQQVIYGYTGLRWGDSGLEPAFAPLLPSRITRLEIRNVHARGRRWDVIVDAKGRRMVARPDSSR